MNIYITTCSLDSKPKSNARIVLDSCLDSFLSMNADSAFTLKGIITPSWKNPNKIKSYKGIPVQTVLTRKLINGKEPCVNLAPTDPELLAYECTNKHIRSHDWASERHSDIDEHQALFEHMKCEYPCLISDGDLLFVANADYKGFVDLLKKEAKSKIVFPLSHLTYLNEEKDRMFILLKVNNFMDGIYYKTMHCRRGLIDKVIAKARS